MSDYEMHSATSRASFRKPTGASPEDEFVVTQRTGGGVQIMAICPNVETARKIVAALLQDEKRSLLGVTPRSHL